MDRKYSIHRFRPTLALGIALGGACLAPAHADDTAPVMPAPPSAQVITVSQPAPALQNTTAGTYAIALPQNVHTVVPLKFGIDDYMGTSNAPGLRGYSDGMWAGEEAAFPSVAYLRWDNNRGSAARVSVGLGSEYTGSSSAVQQPVEAWWQQPLGQASLTVGKFYVPFAQQEWEYESKPGTMLQWTTGANTLAVSANYNQHTRGVNAYARLGRTVSKYLTVGLSLGAGKGLTYDSDHDRGWALDGTLTAGGWQLTSEYEEFLAHSSGRFYFGYGKLTYGNLGRWKPFIGAYQWHDDTDALGRFHSYVYGLDFQLTPNVTVEAGYSPTASQSDHPVSWLQVHTTWER